MSALERSAKPIALAAFSGLHVEFSPAERTTLRQWMIKTFLVHWFLGMFSDKRIHRWLADAARQFYAERTFPLATSVLGTERIPDWDTVETGHSGSAVTNGKPANLLGYLRQDRPVHKLALAANGVALILVAAPAAYVLQYDHRVYWRVATEHVSEFKAYDDFEPYFREQVRLGLASSNNLSCHISAIGIRID